MSIVTYELACAALETLEATAFGSAGCAFVNLAAFIDQHKPSEASGDWMQTYSGGRFYPDRPRAEDIHLNDIAVALSRINRYAGHTQFAYSVAQHSVYVSHCVPPEHALCALMHDATEAYLVDIPRPVKKSLPAYYEMEDKVWRVIADKFFLPQVMPQCVKYADNCVLLAEKAQIMKPTRDEWNIPATPADVKIVRMNDDEAHMFFLHRYNHLIGAR